MAASKNFLSLGQLFVFCERSTIVNDLAKIVTVENCPEKYYCIINGKCEAFNTCNDVPCKIMYWRPFQSNEYLHCFIKVTRSEMQKFSKEQTSSVNEAIDTINGKIVRANLLNNQANNSEQFIDPNNLSGLWLRVDYSNDKEETITRIVGAITFHSYGEKAMESDGGMLTKFAKYLHTKKETTLSHMCAYSRLADQLNEPTMNALFIEYIKITEERLSKKT